MVLGDKHSPRKGPYFKDLVLNKDLFGILGPYLYFSVLIFTILASFTQNCLIFAGIGSGLHCWQIFIFPMLMR